MSGLARHRGGYVKPPPGAVVDCGHPLARQLQGCYLFTEAGGASVYDSTGRLKLAVNGTPTWTGGGSKSFGIAMASVSGSNNVSAVAPKQQTDLTVSFWGRLANTSAAGALVARLTSGESFGIDWVLKLNNAFADKNFVWGWEFVSVASALATWVADRWYNVTCTRRVFANDAPPPTNLWDARIYLDGTQLAQADLNADPRSTTATTMTLGGGGATVLGAFMIWTRYLTPGEVRQLYTEPFAFIVPPARRSFLADVPAEPAAGQPTMRRWGGVPGMVGAGRIGRSW